MNIAEIANNKQLTTEERCVRYLERMRWPDGVACPQCGNKSISSFQTAGKSGKVRHLYQCLERACRYQFSPTTGTIFHDSHLPLSKWFNAIALVGGSEKSMSANQLRLALGVQYKTAVHVIGRIRQAMANGTVELSELSRTTPGSVGGPAESRWKQNPSSEEKGEDKGEEKRHTQRLVSHTQPNRHRASDASLRARREETADFLKQIKPQDTSISPTAVDNMLSMFVSLAQITVNPPLFFVNYLKDKVFT
jgi:Transposase zinc-ribbon domain